MNKIISEEDKLILKTSAIIVIDNLVSTIDTQLNNGVPLLGIAWGLSKGIYGANIQLRQDRALEFVELIRDNPGIFTKEILQTQEFQDGFVYSFQKYLNERSEEKRKIIKNIFLGFTQEENKHDFKLERFLYTIEQLSIEDIEVVKIFSDGTIKQWLINQFGNLENSEIENMSKQPLNIKQIGIYILSEMKGKKQFSNMDYTLEILLRLSSLGLVLGGITATYDYSESNFRESVFGGEFTSYIMK